MLRLAALLVLLTLVGCSGEPETGPAKVTWDRDACERCRMVLSDRHHAAQVRVPPGEGRKWGKVWEGQVSGPDRLRFLGVLSRYAGLINGVEMHDTAPDRMPRSVGKD